MSDVCTCCGETGISGSARCPKCLSPNQPEYDTKVDEYYEGATVKNRDHPSYLKKTTFRDKVNIIRPRLEEEAAGRNKVTYSDIWDGVHRSRIAYVLGAISAIEDHENRPLLSAIVVSSGDEFPSPGFFGLADRLPNSPDDISSRPENEKREWWEKEVKEVHETWSSRS